MGDLRDDASLAARKVAVFSVSLYAAPGYLARRGMPSEPEALMEHDALACSRAHRRRDAMGAHARRRALGGMPPGRATANSPELLMRMALGGAGITVVNDHFAIALFAARRARPGAARLAATARERMGRLPRRRLMPARTRVFLDALAAKFSGPECQAMEAEVAAESKSRGVRPRRRRPRGDRHDAISGSISGRTLGVRPSSGA